MGAGVVVVGLGAHGEASVSKGRASAAKVMEESERCMFEELMRCEKGDEWYDKCSIFHKKVRRVREYYIPATPGSLGFADRKVIMQQRMQSIMH